MSEESEQRNRPTRMVLDMPSMGIGSSPSLLTFINHVENDLASEIEKNGLKIIRGENVKKFINEEAYPATAAGKQQYKDDVKEGKAKNRLKDKDNSKLYNSVWSSLSQDSKETVQNHGLETFKKARDEKNVKGLLDIIKESHGKQNLGALQEMIVGLVTEQSSETMSYARLQGIQNRRLDAVFEMMQAPDKTGLISKDQLLGLTAILSACPKKFAAELAIINATQTPRNYDFKYITQLIMNAESNQTKSTSTAIVTDFSALQASTSTFGQKSNTKCIEFNCNNFVNLGQNGTPFAKCISCHRRRLNDRSKEKDNGNKALHAGTETEEEKIQRYKIEARVQARTELQLENQLYNSQTYNHAAGGFNWMAPPDNGDAASTSSSRR